MLRPGSPIRKELRLAPEHSTVQLDLCVPMASACQFNVRSQHKKAACILSTFELLLLAIGRKTPLCSGLLQAAICIGTSNDHGVYHTTGSDDAATEVLHASLPDMWLAL